LVALIHKETARKSNFSSTNKGLVDLEAIIGTLAEGWVDERDKAILDTIYYCESCNMVLEPGDTDIERHRKDLPNHKLRKVLIVRCGHCGNIVTDSYAQYSPQLNSFWCKNCLSDKTNHREFYGDPGR
jgi:hypothetical protein